MKCNRCKRPSKNEKCEHCLRIEAASELRVAQGEVAIQRARRSSGRGGYSEDSDALAVVPEHVEHVREIYRSSGLGDIEHLPDGRPIFTSAEQKQKAFKIRGFKTGRDGFDQIQSGKDMEIAKQKDLASLQKQIEATEHLLNRR